MPKRAKTDRLLELKGLAGKQQYLLHDQIEAFLDESASVEDMDEVYIALNDLKVDVFDSHEEAQQKLKLKRREEKRPQEKQLLQHPMRYDDPVRMYLREMGRVPLLDREGRSKSPSGSRRGNARSAPRSSARPRSSRSSLRWA